jgi:hypothetical protein
LRILGVARDVPLASFQRHFTLMRTGFGLNALSGMMLLIAYLLIAKAEVPCVSPNRYPGKTYQPSQA